MPSIRKFNYKRGAWRSGLCLWDRGRRLDNVPANPFAKTKLDKARAKRDYEQAKANLEKL